MDPENTVITAITDAEGATDMEADFTFTGAGADPVYIEFGDGEWDYVAAGTSGASHTYTTPGTYTVTATTNGVVVTDSITVPYAP